jgi:hypothetical protein
MADPQALKVHAMITFSEGDRQRSDTYRSRVSVLVPSEHGIPFIDCDGVNRRVALRIASHRVQTWILCIVDPSSVPTSLGKPVNKVSGSDRKTPCVLSVVVTAVARISIHTVIIFLSRFQFPFRHKCISLNKDRLTNGIAVPLIQKVHCIREGDMYIHVPAVGRHRIVKNVPRISTVRKIASITWKSIREFSERHIQRRMAKRTKILA